MTDDRRFSDPALRIQGYHKELLVDLLNRRPDHSVLDHPEWFDDANPEAFLELVDLKLIEGIEYTIADSGTLSMTIGNFVSLTEGGRRVANEARALLAVGTRKVFVSYVREDSEDVDQLCGELEKIGVRTWRDVDELLPGDDWKVAIRRAIEGGAGFICCFSGSLESRSATYMREELTLAVEQLRRRPVDSGWFIPVLLDETRVPDVPIGAGRTLRDLHYIRWYESRERSLEAIVAAMSRLP
ncbi:toll/interleukin-1 receptor domain-containing protein [Amycolatopsis sp. NPDC003731]